ncbi:MAG: hypothetical protein LC776_11125 [Acidobacteria bacterium]|nr:hypothetical protein [Acidobacteriota bacterium]
MNSPTAWAYLPSGDCTIRWQRGDKVAYIFPGKQIDIYPDGALRVEVLATIPVSSKGWTDLADVRLAGENWIKAKRQRCQACGVYS